MISPDVMQAQNDIVHYCPPVSGWLLKAIDSKTPGGDPNLNAIVKKCNDAKAIVNKAITEKEQCEFDAELDFNTCKDGCPNWCGTFVTQPPWGSKL